MTSPKDAEWYEDHGLTREETPAIPETRHDNNSAGIPETLNPDGPAASGPGSPPLFAGYEILRELGHGGMGVVYLARHQKLSRQVALKVIRLGHQAPDSERPRLEVEARTLARLTHPNIVQVYEVGEWQETPAHPPMPYIAMEFVEGGTLAERLVAQKQDLRTLAGWFTQIARAVHRVHQCGIVHRDLKPANILMTVEGEPKVSDFGLAKDLTETRRTMAILGTPLYMAPEQAAGRGDLISLATDIYGLGAMLYEALCGRPPFVGSSTQVVLADVVGREPRPPRRLNRTVPVDLETICLRCLEKEPSRRYPSALELAEDLERYLQGQPIRARPVGSATRFVKWVRRRPTLAATYGLLLLCLVLSGIGLGAIVLMQRAEEQKQRAEESQSLAERNQMLAVEAQQKAEHEQRRAETERQQKEQALTQLQTISYLRNVNLAYREWQVNGREKAIPYLRDCPEKLRNWEWHFVAGLCRLPLLDLEHKDWESIEGHPAPVNGVCFKPDGSRLVSAGDRTIRFWDTKTGKQLRSLEEFTQPIHCVTFSSNGQRVAASGEDGTARVWDSQTGERLVRLTAHETRVLGVCFSPDGQRLASASADQTIRLWDLATSKQFLELKGHTAPIRAVSWHPNGQNLASASDDGTVRVWDVQKGTTVRHWKAHHSSLTAVAYSPRGEYLATASHDQTVRLWNAMTGEELWRLPTLDQVERAVCFSGDGTRLAACGEGGVARVIEVRSGTPLYVLKRNLGPDYSAFTSLSLNHEGNQLALAGKEGRLRVWEVSAGLRALQFDAADMSFSPDGTRLATANGDSTASVWELPSGKKLLHLRGHRDYVRQIAFSGNGALLATHAFSERSLRIWDAHTGEALQNLENIFNDFTFSPDGQHLLTAGLDGVPRIWNPRTAEVLLELKGHQIETDRFGGYSTNQINSVCYSADGLRIASASTDGTTRIWDAQSGKQLLVIKGPETKVAFSPDGTRLLAGGKLWDARTGECLLPTSTTPRGFAPQSFSPDGSRLLGVNEDGAAVLWDVNTGEQALLLQGITGKLYRARFSPDGKTIVTLANRQVLLWSYPEER